MRVVGHIFADVDADLGQISVPRGAFLPEGGNSRSSKKVETFEEVEELPDNMEKVTIITTTTTISPRLNQEDSVNDPEGDPEVVDGAPGEAVKEVAINRRRAILINGDVFMEA